MDGVQDRRVSYRKLATGTEKIYMAVAAFEALVVFGIAFGAFGLIEVSERNLCRGDVEIDLVCGGAGQYKISRRKSQDCTGLSGKLHSRSVSWVPSSTT